MDAQHNSDTRSFSAFTVPPTPVIPMLTMLEEPPELCLSPSETFERLQLENQEAEEVHSRRHKLSFNLARLAHKLMAYRNNPCARRNVAIRKSMCVFFDAIRANEEAVAKLYKAQRVKCN